MVLLKGYDEEGFVFFTNYASHKAADLEANPACSLLLPWHDLQRQVRVDGTARQVDRSVSEEYFATRPRESRLGAWASVAPVAQSGVVAGAEALQAAYDAAEQRFAGGDVPCPPTWGGYVVRPETRGVLAGPAGEDARPAAVPARRGGVGGRAVGAVIFRG